MSQPAPDVDRQTLERVELALPEWAGGFEVLERNLKFDGKQLAHWLAYSHGRLMLVSVVNGEADSCVLRAMDGLSFAQNQPEMLLSSMGAIEDEQAEVQIVLVALEGYSKLQLERLGTLPAAHLALLRRRELSTSRGTHTRMEAVECTEGGRSGPPVTLPEWSLEPEFRPFLARIAPDRLQLALTVVERMRRMDPQFGWGSEGTGLACRLDGKRLARLNWEAGHMQLFLGEDRPLLPIRDEASLETALEALLDVYLDVLSGGRHRMREVATPAAETELPSKDDWNEFSSGEGRSASRPREAAPAPRAEKFREPGRAVDRVHPEPPCAEELEIPRKPAKRDRSRKGTVDPTETKPAQHASTATQASAPSRETSSSEPQPDLPDLPEIDDVEIKPLPPGPLLTREEIEAFLD